MRAIVLALLVAACGSNDTGGHCTLGKACEDYGESDLVAHEKDCKALTGAWAKGTCPASDQVGTCTTDKNITRIYYSGGADAFTKETASASCEHEFHGTWKPR